MAGLATCFIMIDPDLAAEPCHLAKQLASLPYLYILPTCLSAADVPSVASVMYLESERTKRKIGTLWPARLIEGSREYFIRNGEVIRSGTHKR